MNSQRSVRWEFSFQGGQSLAQFILMARLKWLLMESTRVIFHVDMDAFFASIAQLDDPSLRGKPVLTGGDGPRAGATTASYEARPFGCRSAMPMAQARRLCPQAIVVRVPGKRIAEMSAKLFETLYDFSPLVQPVSVDEAYLDMTGSERLLGDPADTAQALRAAIFKRLGLTASVGVSFNKLLAKLGSDLNKPDGLTVINRGDVRRVLDPLPIGRLWGVGPRTADKLERHGIKTIGQLHAMDTATLRSLIGDHGEGLQQLARGEDRREIVTDRQAKSIGHEQTFSQDIEDPAPARAVLLGQAEQVGRRLRKHGLLARGVTVKLRYGDFETITRSATLDRPTDLTDDLCHAATKLFDAWAAQAFMPLRLVGVTAGPICDAPDQGELFADPKRERLQRLDAALDKIVDRFGAQSVHKAGSSPRGSSRGGQG